jgi:hypothetical protein
VYRQELTKIEKSKKKWSSSWQGLSS